MTFVGGHSWSSQTAGGTIEIEVGEAKHPDAALYHELLHADFKLAGYRQYTQIVPTNDRILQLKPLVEALDNELQHHRMFAQFQAAGFPDEVFYDDDDKSAFRKTREKLRKMSPSSSLDDFLLKLLTVIAPGGRGSAEDRRKLRNFLMIKAGPLKAAKLEAIEAHIMAWAKASTFDAGPTLQAIFREFGDCEGGWLGASRAFPDDGVFTGSAFDVSAAETYIRKIA